MKDIFSDSLRQLRNLSIYKSMKDDLKRSILELQLRRSNLVEELKEIDLQIQFLTEQLEKDNDL
tara:strand:+ start:180 stop:371 length:192 start_codon:yes stop_codon:yes gene_type:complete